MCVGDTHVGCVKFNEISVIKKKDYLFNSDSQSEGFVSDDLLGDIP